MNYIRCASIALVLALVMASWKCSPIELVGGGTDIENGKVTGYIVNGSLAPAANAAVRLAPLSMDPVARGLGTSFLTITDSLGRYAFDSVAYDSSCIFVVSSDGRESVLHSAIALVSSITALGTDSLKTPGSVAITLPPGEATAGDYVYIPGTPLFWIVDSIQINSGVLIAHGVPAGVLRAFYYKVKGTSDSPRAFAQGLRVVAGSTVSTTVPSRLQSKKIYLNTTSLGADVAGNVYNFPILVRLNGSNFDFSQVPANGGGIFFSKANGSVLPFEVEQWDSFHGNAELWVKVDTVFGGNDSQHIALYWGNKNAADASNGTSVFDTANGFQGVWHLGESADTIADATANNYSGSRNGGATRVTGIIGYGQIFDSTGFIDMGNVLNPNTASFTVSAWIKRADTALNTIQTIIGKSAGGDPSPIYGWNIGTDLLNRSHCFFASSGIAWGDAETFQMFTDSAITEITAWHYMVAVFDNAGTGNCKVYLDGSNVTAVANQAVIGSLTNTANLRIGAEADGDYPWKGSLDEAVVSYTVRSSDWIKLCYMNQRGDDKLTKVK